ncbi:MAG: hypothetical protein IKN12_11520 [Selenomonadaceae bacterium]|nr:hypothetical protein [Selenomonadaceae bacterium]
MNALMTFPQNNAVVPRWFGIVGDNGFCVTRHEFRIIEAIRLIKNISIKEFFDENSAKQRVYYTYTSRFMSRNFNFGIQPQVPIGVPAELVWIDPDFEAREGKRNN